MLLRNYTDHTEDVAMFFNMYTYTTKQKNTYTTLFWKPGKTAVICAASARSGEIKCFSTLSYIRLYI